MNIVGAIAGQSINGKVGTAAIRYVKDADLYPAIAAYLKEHGVTETTPEQIAAAVDAYLAENPVNVPVQSVNGKIGAVQLTAADVKALAQGDLQTGVDAALAQAKASGAFDGPKGDPGTDGITPTIGDNGNWYLGDTDTGKPSRGETGQAGADGKGGADGRPGADGKDGIGIQSVVQTTTSAEDGGTNVVTVTKTDGTTSTFSIKNGSKGSTGPAGADGHTPVKGADYWTTADQQSIVDDVLAALPTWKGGSY